MKMHIKKELAGIGIFVMLLCTGCGSLPPMTPEQEDEIVGYAAAVALKYDAGYDSRLVELPPEYHKEESPSVSDSTKTEETGWQEEEPAGMDETADTETTDISEEKENASSIESFYNMDGIRIAYKGASYQKTYPSDSVEEYYFTLDAVEGKKLLVMEFGVSNVTDQAVQIDFLLKAPVFRVSLNENRSVNVLSTMLLDDMSTYVGTVEPGETIPLVLVAQVEEQDAVAIQSLVLNMKKGSESAKMILQ